MAEVVVEPLSKAHDRKSFDCGRQAQNEFLQQKARRHAELNYSRTWVAVEAGDSRILGFVTLSMHSIFFDSLDPEIQKGLPKYPMPVLHVGQLATALSVQKKGIGSLLLRFAAEMAIQTSDAMGCYAIELIADNDQALEWYLSKGFQPLTKGSSRLYQAVATLRAARDAVS